MGRGVLFRKGSTVNSVLIITYIGYISTKIVLKEAASIHISLTLASNELDATVVKGYYNTTQRLNTGNVATVKGEDIQKQPVADPILALEGRWPGSTFSNLPACPVP